MIPPSLAVSTAGTSTSLFPGFGPKSWFFSQHQTHRSWVLCSETLNFLAQVHVPWTKLQHQFSNFTVCCLPKIIFCGTSASQCTYTHDFPHPSNTLIQTPNWTLGQFGLFDSSDHFSLPKIYQGLTPWLLIPPWVEVGSSSHLQHLALIGGYFKKAWLHQECPALNKLDVQGFTDWRESSPSASGCSDLKMGNSVSLEHP